MANPLWSPSPILLQIPVSLIRQCFIMHQLLQRRCMLRWLSLKVVSSRKPQIQLPMELQQ